MQLSSNDWPQTCSSDKGKGREEWVFRQMHRLPPPPSEEDAVVAARGSFGLVEDSCGTHMAPGSGGSNRNGSHHLSALLPLAMQESK